MTNEDYGTVQFIRNNISKAKQVLGTINSNATPDAYKAWKDQIDEDYGKLETLLQDFAPAGFAPVITGNLTKGDLVYNTLTETFDVVKMDGSLLVEQVTAVYREKAVNAAAIVF